MAQAVDAGICEDSQRIYGRKSKAERLDLIFILLQDLIQDADALLHRA